MTRIPSVIRQRDAQAADQLEPVVYEEMRRLATQKVAHETAGQPLRATALVHVAYLHLVGRNSREMAKG